MSLFGDQNNIKGKSHQTDRNPGEKNETAALGSVESSQQGLSQKERTVGGIYFFESLKASGSFMRTRISTNTPAHWEHASEHRNSVDSFISKLTCCSALSGLLVCADIASLQCGLTTLADILSVTVEMCLFLLI